MTFFTCAIDIIVFIDIATDIIVTIVIVVIIIKIFAIVTFYNNGIVVQNTFLQNTHKM